MDLHIHTYYSDGADSPEDAVRWAYSQGKSEIAITDHDNIDGVLEAETTAMELGLKFHRGIEFSTEGSLGIGMHILGYDIDLNDERLIEACEEMLIKRKLRNKKMIELLQMSFDIDERDILNKSHSGFIGKPIMARALVEKGYIENMSEAFESVFSKPEFRKIKKDKIATKVAIKIIKDAGGKAVLAHPGLIRGLGERDTEEFYKNFNVLLDELVNWGIDGVECIYRKHSDSENQRFEKITTERGLIVTQGSDYHGKD